MLYWQLVGFDVMTDVSHTRTNEDLIDLGASYKDYSLAHKCQPASTHGPHTSNSRPWRSIGSFMYIGSAGPGPGGQTDGRTVADGGRTGGRTEGGRTEGGRAGQGRF